MPADLLLTLGEGEPGQVAHVLAAHAEVGIDAFVGEPRAQAPEARRTRGSVGLRPGPLLRGVGGRGEVLGVGPAVPGRAHGI